MNHDSYLITSLLFKSLFDKKICIEQSFYVWVYNMHSLIIYMFFWGSSLKFPNDQLFINDIYTRLLLGFNLTCNFYFHCIAYMICGNNINNIKLHYYFKKTSSCSPPLKAQQVRCIENNHLADRLKIRIAHSALQQNQ